MKRNDVILALLVAVIWGTSFTAIKLCLAGAPPLLLAALRFAFAALPAVFLVRRPAIPLRYLLAYGVTAGVGQFGCLFSAIHLGMPAGIASVVLQSQAFFTLLFAALFLRETITPSQLAGIALSSVGLYFVGDGNVYGFHAAPRSALLLTLSAAAFWGISNIVVRRAASADKDGERLDMFALVVWSSLVPPLPLFLLALALYSSPVVFGALASLSWESIVLIVYLALVATLFGFGAWSNLLSRYASSHVAPFSMLVPVGGIITARLVLGEHLAPIQWWGCLLAITGLFISVYGVQQLYEKVGRITIQFIRRRLSAKA